VYLKYLGIKTSITINIRIVNYVYVETTVSEQKKNRNINCTFLEKGTMESYSTTAWRKRERELTET
jgi:hypothetical protein